MSEQQSVRWRLFVKDNEPFTVSAAGSASVVNGAAVFCNEHAEPVCIVPLAELRDAIRIDALVLEVID